MLAYPEIDPVAVSLGPLKVHWYGLMYLFGFAAAWFLGVRRAKKDYTALQPDQVEDFIFYGAMGLVVGARFGYVFFYNFDKFLADPLWLFAVHEGGMSFHGGLIGVVLAIFLYARKIGISFVDLADFVCPLAPIGIAAGRMGNFIGQELWGRETDAPWGMVFPNDPLGLVRHPSQLYESFMEGLVLFVIVWWFSAKKRPPYAVSGLFLFLYGTFRFFIEFFREPDSHIGFDLFGWMSRGQLLCTPMIIGGLLLLTWAYVVKRNADQATLGAKAK